MLRKKFIGVKKIADLLTKLSSPLIKPSHAISQADFNDSVMNGLTATVMLNFFKHLFNENSGAFSDAHDSTKLLKWLLSELGVEDEMFIETPETQAANTLSNLAQPSAIEETDSTVATANTTNSDVGAVTPGTSHAMLDDDERMYFSGGSSCTESENEPLNLFNITPKSINYKLLSSAKSVVSVVDGDEFRTIKRPVDGTPEGGISFDVKVGRGNRSGAADVIPVPSSENTIPSLKDFKTPRKELEDRKKSKALSFSVDFENKSYRPSNNSSKSNKGLPKEQPMSKFSLCDVQYLCESLGKMGAACPECGRRLQISCATFYHSFQLKVVCTGSSAVSFDFSESTEDRVRSGELSVDESAKRGYESMRDLGICNFNKLLCGSRRMKMQGDTAKGIFKRGSDDNKVSFNFVTQADFALLTSCHLAMISYSQYTTIFGSSSMKMTTLQKPQFYSVSTTMFEKEKLRGIFGQQSDFLKSLARNHEYMRLKEQRLAMDTTYSQRRHANYAVTLLMSSDTGLIYDFECLSRKANNVQAIQLEAIASERLVDSALEDLKNGVGPQFNSICTDGHIDNADMMQAAFYEFNKINSQQAIYEKPTRCGMTALDCLKAGEITGNTCGYHARELSSTAGEHWVTIGSVSKIVPERLILEFAFRVEDHPKNGDLVHVTENIDCVVKHSLDLWHAINTLERAFEKKMSFVPEDVQANHKELLLKSLKDELWNIVHSGDVNYAFTNWRRCCLAFGSIFEAPDHSNTIHPAMVRACEEIIFGNDETIAELVQNDRIQAEKFFVGCKCPNGSDCECGKFVNEVDYVKKIKARKENRKGRGVQPVFDEKKIRQLMDCQSKSSYCECANSYVHLNITKRRHYPHTHWGRVAYLLSKWNVRGFHVLYPNHFVKGELASEEVWEPILSDTGHTMDDIKLCLTEGGIEQQIFEDMHLLGDDYPEELYYNTYEFINC